MYAYYQMVTGLHQDDIDGIRAIYATADGGLPEFLFDDFNNAHVDVVPLGDFFGSNWAINVVVDLSGVPPDPGIGFSVYNPTHGDFSIHNTQGSGWLSFSWQGVWAGNGSDFVLSTSALYMDIHPLWTSPPTRLPDGSDDDPASQ